MSADSTGSRLSEPDAAQGATDVSASYAAEPEISSHYDVDSADEGSTDPDLHYRHSEDSQRGRTRRQKRPTMPSRKSSGTIIVPRDRSTNSDTEPNEYPPDDARAMSPRRGSEETKKMEKDMREKMQHSARETQLTLLEIAESIELVRQSHSQLQRQNEMLQDYIGGLTRSMSAQQTPSRSVKSGKK